MTLTAEIAPAWPLAALDSADVPFTLTALEPVTQTSRVAGNTQLLRMQEVVLPDGSRRPVPYVSGASIRHHLRDALAWHLCRLLDVPDRSLPKLVVDLLWSGGSVTETGAQAGLATARRVHGLLPGLGMMGYSARSDVLAGTLLVRNAHLVCQENAWRLPARLQGHPHAALRSGALRSEEFGTRHDVAGTPAGRYIAMLEGTPLETTQMIWDTQVIRPGSVLWSGVRLSAPTAGHVAALATAIDVAAPLEDGRRVLFLGGKRNQGMAACSLDAVLSPLGDVAALRAEYEERLAASRDEVLPLLREVTGA